MILENKGKFIFAITFIMGFVIFASSFFMTEYKIENKDCYDRYKNKIVGLSCVSEGEKFTEEGRFLVGIGLVIIFISMFGSSISSIGDHGTNIFGFEEEY